MKSGTIESEGLLDNEIENETMYHELEISEDCQTEIKPANNCPCGTKKYIFAAAVASLGGVLFGYDLGIISGALLQLKTRFQLDCRQQEMVVSSMLFGALLGSLAGGYMIDYFGRRKTIISNAMVFIIGAFALALTNSYGLLIVGRLIVGFATSISAIAECIYIAEIAPAKRRGLLVSLNEIGIVSGLLLAYLVNHIFIDVENGWRFMFGLSGIPALIQGFGIIFLPASPRWLVCQRQDTQALQVMRSLNNGSNAEEEMTKIKNSLNLERKFNICYLFGRNQNMRGRMFVGLGLVFFQQFTGQPSVLYYAPSILESIGFRSHSAATLATVGVGIAKLLATIITLFLVDKAGRRCFLLGGPVLMTISLGALFCFTQAFPGDYHKDICSNYLEPTSPPLHHAALTPSPSLHTLNNHTTTPLLTCVPSAPTTSTTHGGFNTTQLASSSVAVKPSGTTACLPATRGTSLNGTTRVGHVSTTMASPQDLPTSGKYLAVLALMLFAGAYSCSYGPVGWLVLSEIFPTEIKGRAFAATTVLNWGSNLVVAFTMLDLIDVVGVSWTFLIYAAIGVVAIIFIYTFLPETKNRSLEEIDALFTTRNTFTGSGRCSPPSCSCCRDRYTRLNL